MKNSLALSFTFCLGLTLSHSTLTSQSIKSYDKVEIQTLYINAKDSLVRFQVMSENKNLKFEPDLLYYWFKSNTILKTTGGADGKLLNGEYTCFYSDNNLKEKGKFLKGVKDGSWLSWHNTGKMKELVSWKKGRMHGNHILYDLEGKEANKEVFKNGKLKENQEKKKKIVSPKTKKTKPQPSIGNNATEVKQKGEKVTPPPVQKEKNIKKEKPLPKTPAAPPK